MQEHISAGCYLLRKNNNKYELLVIHRTKLLGEEKYVLPKGHVEGKETLEEAAKREVSEETGLFWIFKLFCFITFGVAS